MSAEFDHKIHETLENPRLQLAIYTATGRLKEKRIENVAPDVLPDYQELRAQANALKADASARRAQSSAREAELHRQNAEHQTLEAQRQKQIAEGQRQQALAQKLIARLRAGQPDEALLDGVAFVSQTLSKATPKPR